MTFRLWPHFFNMLIFEKMGVMKKCTTGLFFILCMVGINDAGAQQLPKCGFDHTVKAIIETFPAYADSFSIIKDGGKAAAYKTSALADTPVIPVVFHIVLTRAQLASIGDTAGLRRRIESQVAVLNRDFNLQNADASKIPGGFRGLAGNAEIRFGLAHTAPDGTASAGFELVITEKNGFNIEREAGSGFGFSGAKYTYSGGANAWDVASYLNIWVINPLEDGAVTNILGLAIPAYLTGKEYGINPVEQGLVLHYAALGARQSPFELFPKGSDQGRTLVHEVGHFFELLHIWGDDEGKCPGTGGADDGIADTPPQSYSSTGCSTYPKYDGCTKTGDGIMFMNYMDYSSDTCLLMFTHGQVARMRQTMQPGGYAYSLTQQPRLLNYPGTAGTIPAADFIIYPNPADDVVNIVFPTNNHNLRSVQLTDQLGRVVAVAEYDRQSLIYVFSVANLYSGIYFVVVDFDTRREVRKLLVR